MHFTHFRRLLAWYFIYASPRHAVTVDTANGLLSFDNKDWLIGKYLYIRRGLELVEMQEAMRVLSELGYIDGRGDTLLDVGANIGMTCISMMKAGSFQRAFAFEPAPETYRFLVRNIAQNGLDRKIVAFPFALSSRSGARSMEITKDNSGDNRLRVNFEPGFFGEELRPKIDVPAKTMDELLAELPELRDAKIDLVWVDIQGHEGHFFRGAKSLLGRGVPAVSEFWPYGILRSATSEREFAGIVSQLFTHFYVLSKQPAIRQEITELPALFERYRDPRKFCSVLWLNANLSPRPR